MSELDQPTVLLVGEGERMHRALVEALERHGLLIEQVAMDRLVEMAFAAAPDVLVLLGDAAADGGEEAVRRLAEHKAASLVPVVLLSDKASLGSRLAALRQGVVAIVPKSASADGMARRIAEVARELPERPGEVDGDLGEATVDELVSLFSQQLRSGILSVTADEEGGASAQVVLRAGRPVTEAIEELVERLRPLLSAKPGALHYEFHESPDERLGSLADELDEDFGGLVDAETFAQRRVLVVEKNPARADVLVQELRARGALVVVADGEGAGLERARAQDPELVVIDGSGVDGWALETLRTLRRDPRLRWASLLVVDAAELWPDPAAGPDMRRLAQAAQPLLAPDRELADRVASADTLDVRLERLGPSRTLRALIATGLGLGASLWHPRVRVGVDVADGLVVGAMAKGPGGDTIAEGPAALAALMGLASGRLRISRRDAPASANVMSPIEDALAAASRESSPVRPSIPPPEAAPPSRPSGRPREPEELMGKLEMLLERLQAVIPETRPRSAPPPARKPVPKPPRRGIPKPKVPTAAIPPAKVPPPSPPRPSTHDAPTAKVARPHPSVRPPRRPLSAPEISIEAVSPTSRHQKRARKATLAFGSSPVAGVIEVPAALRSASPSPESATAVAAPEPTPEAAKRASPSPSLPSPSAAAAGANAPIARDGAMRSPPPWESRPIRETGEAMLPDLSDPDSGYDDEDIPVIAAMAEPGALGVPEITRPERAVDPLSPPTPPPDRGAPVGTLVTPPSPAAATEDELEVAGLPKRRGRGCLWVTLLGGLGLGVAAAAVVLFAPAAANEQLARAGLPPFVPLGVLDELTGGEPVAVRPEAPDAGGDDAGIDAGVPDAGADAGPLEADAGAPSDGSVDDAGAPLEDGGADLDAGSDGGPDAGTDAGVDAGPTETDESEEPDERPTPAAPGSVLALIRSANSARNRGDFAPAIRDYRAVLQRSPNHPRALAGLTRTAMAQSDRPSAIRWARRLVGARPRNPSNHVLLGDTYRAAGNQAAAQRAYRDALALSPNHRAARQRLAQ